MSGIIARATGNSEVSVVQTGLPQPPQDNSLGTGDLPSVYFTIAIYKTTPEEEMISVDTISIGSTYTLVLSSGINSRNHAQQEAVNILSTIKLELKITPGITSEIPILNEDIKYVLNYAQAIDFEEALTLTIPLELPSCTLTFELVYRQGLKRYAPPQSAAKLEVKIQGVHKPLDEKIVNIFHIDKVLPEKVAVLLIEQYTPKEDKYLLSGSNHLLELPQTLPKHHVELSLAGLFKTRNAQGRLLHSEHDIINKLHRFSRGDKLPELRAWLYKLYSMYGKDLNVIIMDNTSFEFPWEMFEFEAGHFLGAKTRVVRWMPFTFFDTTYKLNVREVMVPQTGGSVIAYLDKGLGAEVIKAEQEMLQGIQIKQDCPSLDEFDYWIRQSITDVGLVYLGCHGHEGDALVPQDLPGDYTQQRAAKLRALDFELPEPKDEPRPLFFINACESARLAHSKGDEPYGFVDACMTYFASGYIGPVGEVGVKEASLIAKYIVEKIKQRKEMPISEVLRLLRDKAAKEFIESEGLRRSERAIPSYKFLFAFMYVYYGSPFACLHLQPTTKDQTMEVST